MSYPNKFTKFEDAIKNAHTLGDRHCSVIGAIEQGGVYYYVEDNTGSAIIFSHERLIYEGPGKNAKGEAIPE